MTNTENRYIVVYECKEAKCDDGSLMTKSGEKALLCKGEWGPTGRQYPSCFGLSGAIQFNSEQEAHKFMRKYKGHPWYYKCNGNYEVIKIKPVYKQVIDRWDVADV